MQTFRHKHGLWWLLPGCALALFGGFFLLCMAGWGLGHLLNGMGVTR